MKTEKVLHYWATRCVWVGLSYAIFGAILCDNDCINRFETKRLYWILV
jgi:hypothetical protein